MTIKYMLFPGYVTSVNDGDTHYIGVRRLAWLYSVPLSECVVGLPCGRILQGQEQLIKLYPRADGNYTVPQTP